MPAPKYHKSSFPGSYRRIFYVIYTLIQEEKCRKAHKWFPAILHRIRHTQYEEKHWQTAIKQIREYIGISAAGKWEEKVKRLLTIFATLDFDYE